VNFAPTEEQLMVRDMVRKFAESEIKPIAAELDHTHRHPEEICRKLGEMGIMGVSVPTEYGGAGMDNVTYVMAMIEISKACASCGVIVSVNNTLYGHPVKTFGTHEQKLKFLAPVAGGQVEGCYGLTEAGAGSDAAELLLLRAAWLEDNGKDFQKESAMSKYYSSDVAMNAAIECVQIFGGYGYIKEYPAERHMRDAKICQIYEGTNEIQRVVVARKLIGLR